MPTNKRGMPNDWSDFPKHRDPVTRRWLCRRCGKPLGGRKTSWCDRGCLKAVLLLVRWPYIRQFILRRDKRICQVCGEHATEVDHIMEVQDGGKSIPENLRAICHKDHVAKTNLARRLRMEKRQLALALLSGHQCSEAVGPSHSQRTLEVPPAASS